VSDKASNLGIDAVAGVKLAAALAYASSTGLSPARRRVLLAPADPGRYAAPAASQSMIRKSVRRFSETIMLKQ
jgi:hypothetical protein